MRPAIVLWGVLALGLLALGATLVLTARAPRRRALSFRRDVPWIIGGVLAVGGVLVVIPAVPSIVVAGVMAYTGIAATAISRMGNLDEASPWMARSRRLARFGIAARRPDLARACVGPASLDRRHGGKRPVATPGPFGSRWRVSIAGSRRARAAREGPLPAWAIVIAFGGQDMRGRPGLDRMTPRGGLPSLYPWPAGGTESAARFGTTDATERGVRDGRHQCSRPAPRWTPDDRRRTGGPLATPG